jgi:hypothetical protein
MSPERTQAGDEAMSFFESVVIVAIIKFLVWLARLVASTAFPQVTEKTVELAVGSFFARLKQRRSSRRKTNKRDRP